MSRIRKYRPGPQIRTIARLGAELAAQRYVYLLDRPCHPSWVISMQYNTVTGFLRRGAFKFARINKEWEPKA